MELPIAKAMNHQRKSILATLLTKCEDLFHECEKKSFRVDRCLQMKTHCILNMITTWVNFFVKLWCCNEPATQVNFTIFQKINLISNYCHSQIAFAKLHCIQLNKGTFRGARLGHRFLGKHLLSHISCSSTTTTLLFAQDFR